MLVLYGVNVIRTGLSRTASNASPYPKSEAFNQNTALSTSHRQPVRNKLGRWQRTTTAFTSIKGTRIEVRMDVRPDPMATTIAKTA